MDKSTFGVFVFMKVCKSLLLLFRFLVALNVGMFVWGLRPGSGVSVWGFYGVGGAEFVCGCFI